MIIANSKAPHTGWYTVAVNTDSPVEIPFELAVSYAAPSKL